MAEIMSARGKSYLKKNHEMLNSFVKCNETENVGGYGHREPSSKTGTVTQAEADAWFESDVKEAENSVNVLVKRKLNQGQFNALVGVAYDMSPKNFSDSDLLKKVNDKASAKAVKDAIKNTTGCEGNPENGTKRRRFFSMLWTRDRDRMIIVVAIIVVIFFVVMGGQRRRRRRRRKKS